MMAAAISSPAVNSARVFHQIGTNPWVTVVISISVRHSRLGTDLAQRLPMPFKGRFG